MSNSEDFYDGVDSYLYSLVHYSGESSNNMNYPRPHVNTFNQNYSNNEQRRYQENDFNNRYYNDQPFMSRPRVPNPYFNPQNYRNHYPFRPNYYQNYYEPSRYPYRPNERYALQNSFNSNPNHNMDTRRTVEFQGTNSLNIQVVTHNSINVNRNLNNGTTHSANNSGPAMPLNDKVQADRETDLVSNKEKTISRSTQVDAKLYSSAASSTSMPVPQFEERSGVTTSKPVEKAGIIPSKTEENAGITPSKIEEIASITSSKTEDKADMTPSKTEENGGITPSKTGDKADMTPSKTEENAGITPSSDDLFQIDTEADLSNLEKDNLNPVQPKLMLNTITPPVSNKSIVKDVISVFSNSNQRTLPPENRTHRASTRRNANYQRNQNRRKQNSFMNTPLDRNCRLNNWTEMQNNSIQETTAQLNSTGTQTKESNSDETIDLISDSDNDEIMEIPNSPVPLIDLVDSENETENTIKSTPDKIQHKEDSEKRCTENQSNSAELQSSAKKNASLDTSLLEHSGVSHEQNMSTPTRSIENNIFATPKSKNKKRKRPKNKKGKVDNSDNLSTISTDSKCSDDFLQSYVDDSKRSKHSLEDESGEVSNQNKNKSSKSKPTVPKDLIADLYETESSCCSDLIEKDSQHAPITSFENVVAGSKRAFEELDLNQFADMITTSRSMANNSNTIVSTKASRSLNQTTSVSFCADDSHKVIATDSSKLKQCGNFDDTCSSSDESEMHETCNSNKDAEVLSNEEVNLTHLPNYEDFMFQLENKIRTNQLERTPEEKSLLYSMISADNVGDEDSSDSSDETNLKPVNESKLKETSTESNSNDANLEKSNPEKIIVDNHDGNNSDIELIAPDLGPTVMLSSDEEGDKESVISVNSISDTGDISLNIDREINKNQEINSNNIKFRKTNHELPCEGNSDSISREEERARSLKMRFDTYWTPDRQTFYNTSWGGEHYDHEEERYLMAGSSAKWANPIDKYYSSRSFTEKVRCRNCRQMGHIKSNCPTPVKPCSMCGSRKHREFRCQESCCLNCYSKYDRRPFTINCKRCNNWKNVHCKNCENKGHIADFCPDLWRRYHLTVKPGNVIRPKEPYLKRKATTYCSICAEKGHLSESCRYFYNILPNRPNPLSITNYSDLYERSHETSPKRARFNEENNHWDIHKVYFNTQSNSFLETGNQTVAQPELRAPTTNIMPKVEMNEVQTSANSVVTFDIPVTASDIERLTADKYLQHMSEKYNATLHIISKDSVKYLHGEASNEKHEELKYHLNLFITGKRAKQTKKFKNLLRKIENDYPLVEEVLKLENPYSLYQEYKRLLKKNYTPCSGQVVKVAKKMNAFRFLHSKQLAGEQKNLKILDECRKRSNIKNLPKAVIVKAHKIVFGNIKNPTCGGFEDFINEFNSNQLPVVQKALVSSSNDPNIDLIAYIKKLLLATKQKSVRQMLFKCRSLIKGKRQVPKKTRKSVMSIGKMLNIPFRKT